MKKTIFIMACLLIVETISLLCAAGTIKALKAELIQSYRDNIALESEVYNCLKN